MDKANFKEYLKTFLIKRKCKFSAFTLAEILIVMGIIGVIAETTIPTLINDFQDKSSVVQLKKTVSTIQQAVNTARQNDGEIDDWYSGTVAADASTAIANTLTPYFKVLTYCGTNAGCTPTGYYRYLAVSSPFLISFDSTYYKMILADGTLVYLSASMNGGTSCIWYISAIVDVNGYKGPNRWGSDLFKLVIYSNTAARTLGYNSHVVVPFGVTKMHPMGNATANPVDNYCNKDNVNYDGSYCTAWAYYMGNEDYKYVNDLNWDTKTQK